MGASKQAWLDRFSEPDGAAEAIRDIVSSKEQLRFDALGVAAALDQMIRDADASQRPGGGSSVRPECREALRRFRAKYGGGVPA